MCEEGYIGAPTDSNQCYQQLSINVPVNFTLLPSTSVALATDLDYTASNVDVQIHFVARYGELIIYDTLNNRAVSVSVNSSRFHHVAIVREGFQVSRFSREILSNQMRRRRQAVDIADVFVYELSSSGRLTITIPAEQDGFESLQHYITILAGPAGAQFYVFYEQEIARLNYFVFFSIILSCFLLTFGIALFIWKLIRIEMKRRARIRARQTREARASRPFVKVRVYFDRMNMRDSNYKKKESLKESISKVSFVTLDSNLFTKNVNNQSNASILKQSKRHCRNKSPVSPLNLVPWPLAREVINGDKVSIHTLLIKLPTKSRVHKGHVICTGSCLARQPAAEDTKNWKKMRNNRCSPLVTVEQAATQL